MSSYVLCIFEGVRTEQNIINSLTNHFINDTEKTVLKASFGFNIYQLFQKVKEDEFFDVYEIVVEEIEKRNNISLADREVIDIQDFNEISDIYLFFDYDCHCSNADDDKLKEMLELFDNSQDRGKLCISYPMVESIRHIKSRNYHELMHPITNLRDYKNIVNNDSDIDRRYFNWGNYDAQIWKEIIQVNLARAFYLTNDEMVFPQNQIEQIDIFEKQILKHIPHSRICVLSSFPFMLHDFYGAGLNKILRDLN
jgi:hypothetical protein